MVQFKVEVYQKEAAEGHANRKRVGDVSINLCSYIGRGVVTETFHMDKSPKTDHVYLTARI